MTTAVPRQPSTAAPATPVFATEFTVLEPVRFDARDLDHSTSARSDLDAFVNARWRAANPVPTDRTSWGSFEVLVERGLQLQAQIATIAASTEMPSGSAQRVVGDFWASGMDAAAVAAGFELLRAQLRRIDALNSPAAIAAHLHYAHAHGRGLLFQFDARPDFANPHLMIAYIMQGGLGLPDRSYYLEPTPDAQTKRHAYLDHIAAILELSGWTRGEAREHADDVLAFETRLARVSLPRCDIARDIAALYRPIDIAAADRLCPNLCWSAFFAAQGLAMPERFSLAMPDFHAEIESMLSGVSAATWRAYLRFHTADAAMPCLGDECARQHHLFHGQALRGRREMRPRWTRVLNVVNDAIGEALGELYVARAFSPESKRGVQTLVEQLRAALESRLRTLDWMGAQTKARALNKLAAFTAKIGYPERWRDWSELATSRRNFYGNVLAACAFNQRWTLAKIGRPVSPDDWSMTPQTVNAGYDPQRNEVVFPAAILQPPLFDPHADSALNYGGIGAVIAHEMTHAYDDQGSRFGPQGQFEDWWIPADRTRFEALAAALVNQFNRQTTIDGEPVDGNLTLGENIADFGGVTIAYAAMQRTLARDGRTDPLIDGYTQSQRFFLNWAVIWRQTLTPEERRLRLTTDVHAPANVRANAAPRNLSAYAQAFGCSPADPMQRADADRIRIW